MGLHWIARENGQYQFVPNLFPTLVRLDEYHPRGVSHFHWEKLRKVAAEVRHRCSARAWYDTIRREFCVGIDDGGYPRLIAGWPAFSADGLIEYDFAGIEPTSVDDIVYAVQLAAVDEAKKDRWIAAHEKRRNDDEAKRRESHFLSNAPAIQKDMNDRRKNKVTVMAS